MSIYDYDGDMEFYQRQLSKAGITKEMLDMDDYIGLTAIELQVIVDNVIELYEEEKDGKRN